MLSEEPDKELGDPNKNPWYVLATIYGEQPEGANWIDFDEKLAEENRRAWNGWFCSRLSDKERSAWAQKAWLSQTELNLLSQTELSQLQILFKKRMEIAGVDNSHLPDFPNYLDFSGLHFSRPLIFYKFIFVLPCSFEHSTFSDNTNFKSAVFTNFADFNSTIFDGFTNFNSAHFDDDVFFNFATINGYANFLYTGFNGTTEFNSAKFKSTTLFSHAKFSTHVPEFHATKLYDDTVFSLPDDFTDNWPPISGTVEIEGQDEPVPVMPAAEQKRAYNRLRMFMSKSLQVDEEQYFHRMEMRCKAQTQSWPYRLLFKAYEAISDYGNSIWRPIGWLGVVWLVGMLARIKWVEISWIQNGWEHHGWGPKMDTALYAMGWSFANIFSFFGFQRRYFAGEELNFPLNLLSATQTIFGFILLFLLGLGLRNRFRLR